jgi:hypothetical protein
MKTQVKNFSVKLLKDLIDNKHFINITNGGRDLNVVPKFNFGIKQEMLYAVEKSSGEFIIFSNNVINTLIFEKELRESKGLIRESRLIGYTDIQICILKSDSQEETRTFKLITKQV